MKYKHGLAFPDADDYLFDRLPASGVWQQDALTEALKHCRQFRTAIDGGAHVGTWSLELAKHFRQILAFEPATDTFECLEKNTAGVKNIAPLPWAIGASNGYVTMNQSRKDMNRRHTGARYAVDGGSTKRVTIDSLYSGCAAGASLIDLIKLDLEGGEPDALIGATETLKRCRPVVIWESKRFEHRYGHPRGHAATILRELGATEFAVCGINRVWGWA